MKSKLSYLYIFLLAFGLDYCSLSGEPIYLKNADELVGQHTESSSERILIGNVIIQQKNVTVSSDYAIQYLNQNRFLMRGNVIITQDSLVLKSNSVSYDGNTYIATSNEIVTITDGHSKLIGNRGTYSTKTLIANFNDNVVLKDDSVTIFADNVIYKRASGESIASGDVTIKGNYQNTFLQADTALNYPATNIAIAWGNSVLFQIDSTALESSIDSLKSVFHFDTLSIVSDSMIAYRSEELYHFIENVEIVRANVKAKANFAKYNTLSNDITLFNSNVALDSGKSTGEKPIQSIVWLDSTQLHADSILIKLEDNKLKEIFSFGNCISVSANDTLNSNKLDQLAGDEIVIYVEQDTLRKIESIGQAKALFFTKNSEDLCDGLIESTAEQIIIEIEDNQANNVTLIKDIPGKYHPEPLVYGKEQDFYLPNFTKSDNIPSRPSVRIINSTNKDK